MEETNTKDKDIVPVYEISYLVVSSISEDKLEGEVSALHKLFTEASANIIAEEAPHKETLAYTMRKKTVSGAYEKCDEAYFGWVKFELDSSKVEELKKGIEKHPSILRTLLVSTVSENTYLGKRASAIAASFSARSEGDTRTEERPEVKKEIAPVAPASVEEMDKSIDEMVKVAI
jgi:ribosomal protein S6